MNDTDENVFEEWGAYAHKRELKLRKMDLNELERNSKLKIVAITGIRRSGKSSVAMLLMQKLLKENKKAAYVNLEDSRIKGAEGVLDSILKWFGDSGYLLLDEITNAKDWEGWLARNHELLKGKLHLVVSSSRKKLAVPSKPLRGRMLAYELYPLSFKEFLEFKEIPVERTTAGIGRIEKALKEYLTYGGFPEVVLTEEKTDKVQLMGSYFRDIIGLDVAEISRENVTTVELFGKYTIEASYFSASKCLNFFKSLGHKIGKQSILDLEKHAQDSYLFFFVPVFSRTIKDRSQYPRKSYMGDTGFMYALTGKSDMGKLFENAVLLELRRRKELNEEINYWRNKGGVESDFVVRRGTEIKEIIQVSYDIGSEKTKEREARGLVECAKSLGVKEGIIITNDKDATETVDRIRIAFIPLWKWLLESD
ncbi:ATP-binding protein [Candidatus Gottesmanbacteria bacterium]|nr:ATP-binding protein [Candidatus Gottesmanbacteria bacterium]